MKRKTPEPARRAGAGVGSPGKPGASGQHGTRSNLRTLPAHTAPDTRIDAPHPDHACSFPPVAAAHAHTLILGSMPGRDSLRASRYYAHSRNAFWPIVTSLLGASADLDYDARLALLRERGYALWDVLASCTRPGSLDTAIDPASIVPNDFATFFAAHPHIDRVFFNGSTAEALFRRHVLPRLARTGIAMTRLPSTSPAHAARSLEAKRAAWRAIVRP